MLECSEIRSTVESGGKRKDNFNKYQKKKKSQEKFTPVTLRNNKVELRLAALASVPARRKTVSTRLLWTMH